MNKNACARCAKPVYFAERKTSLGRDWHPSCLRCVQCGRVLSPGQHAEHKGNPYCHTPCYNALFGPNLLGYGSNLASPANFAKKENAAEFGHDYDDDVYKREIYSTSRNSAAAVRRQKQRQSAPPSIIGHDFSAAPPASPDSRTNLVLQSGGKKSAALSSTRSADSLDTTQCGSSVDRPSLLATGPLVDSSVNDHPSELKSSTNSSPSANKSTVNHSRSKSEQVLSAVVDNHQSGLSSVVRGQDGNVPGTKSPPANSVGSSDVPASEEYSVKRTLPESGYLAPAVKKDVSSPAKRDILEKVESFNSHYEGKVHHQMTVDQTAGGDVKIHGPLRIYWGLSRPIQLRHCDDVPALPISKWRHSLCSNLNEGVPGSSATSSPARKLLSQGSPSFMSPSRPLRGIDDSVLMSPSSSSADEVVLRRQKVRKFNTVSYRSDAPTKWKRASINGHIFNYDTSVFIPVLGSSTSVMADSTMTSPVVIRTLLEKFKVENSPGEYVLSVVTEKGDQTQERLLGEGDRPLFERLLLGADDHYAKIFLKERRMEPEVMVPDAVQLPIMEEEEETLPAEVEQLLILPVAVLKGIMVKYEKDEDDEVRLLKRKYELVKRKIHQRLEDMKTA